MSIFGTPSVGVSTGLPGSTATVNTNVGDLIVVEITGDANIGIFSDANGTTTKVTDTIGNTYILLTTQVNTTGSGSRARIAYCLSSIGSNASNVITATLSGVTNGGIVVCSVPVTGGVVSFDVEAGAASNTTVTSHVTSSFSTAGADEIGFCVAQNQTSQSATEWTGPTGTGGTSTTDAQGVPNNAGHRFGGAGHITWTAPQSSITLTMTSASSVDTCVAAAMFTGTPNATPVVSGWLPTEGQHSVVLKYAQPDWVAPPKFGLIVAVPPTIANWTPTIGQKALPQPYHKPTFNAPEKVLPFIPPPPNIAGWRPTIGNKAVPQPYHEGIFAGPDKFGIVTPSQVGYVNLAGSIQFTISPTGYVRLRGTVLQASRQFINLTATIVSKVPTFVNLAGRIVINTRNYVKLNSTLTLGNRNYVKLNGTIATIPTSRAYVQLLGTIRQKLTTGPCGGFPDSSFINLAGWIVNPASTNDSRQMPGQGFTITDDWLSSNDALNSYKPTSRFTVFGSTLPSTGVGLLITAFTAGVVSFQTRTRTWLRRVDQASSGILLNTKTNVHTLPNGTVVTTTTQTRQQQDTLVTITTIQNSGTPTRTSTIISEKNGSGQTVTREIETDTINGIVNSLEKKNIITSPPTSDNPQPLVVRTLDGQIHYQFFTAVNPNWAGGDQEGLTTITKATQIVPGTLNGKTTDPFGNPIYNEITDETETDPTGKTIQTHTEQIGTRRDIGTTTTDTTEQLAGLQTIITKTITYPDGSSKVVKTTANPINGDKVQVTTENVTDEYGQVTTTVTNEETKIFPDPVTGALRQTVTKTVNVTKGAVTTTDTSIDTNTDFEDDIIRNKVKVYFIQEFTMTCVIDEFSMLALSEINITHQRNYALLELFGQQLGNANLSYNLRQQLINQFNQANGCIAPVTLQALGRNYRVVFAQSASAFRAKYIPGTEPHCYELQMILQERSDLMNGAFGG